VEEDVVPSIEQHLINRECTFINQNSQRWFVIHFTGGTPNLQSLYNYWQSSCVSSHFGIERSDNQYAKAGAIWQFVNLWDGAGSNCCSVSGACAPWFEGGHNWNVDCITVECINPNSDNSGLCTGPQYDSLVWLIREICGQVGISTTKYTEYTNSKGISFTFGDGNGGVVMHRDFDQVNRARCPGMDVYQSQMKQIMQEVNGGASSDRSKYVTQFVDRNGWIVDMWNSFYYRLNDGIIKAGGQPLPIPRRETGIFAKWKELLIAGNCMGGVMSEEYPYEKYMLQNFTSGQISFDTVSHTIEVIYPG
jgi:N-acetylmuramoyl-L-alanine amidase